MDGQLLRARLARAVNRLALPSGHRSAGPTATMADVVACYRLLLGRRPDETGLTHYRRRLAGGAMSVGELTQEFMASEEFRTRHRDLLAPEASVVQRVETEDFVIFLDMSDWAVSRPIARTGSHEPETGKLLRSLLAEGDTMVDVGANVGWFSLLAARQVGRRGRVLALEPNPANCLLMERSVAENGFAQVEIVAAAASDRSGIAALETDGSNGRMLSLDPAPRQALSCSFVVPIEPLDELVGRAGLERVDVVKIDVEGAESLVLKGALAIIERHRPAIVCEFFPALMRDTAGCEPRDLLTQLRKLGYELSVVGGAARASDDAILGLFDNDSGLDHIDLLASPAVEHAQGVVGH